MINGTILYFRHSLNIIICPSRPLPSWNGWIRSTSHGNPEYPQNFSSFSVVLCQQSFHFIGNFFRKCCIHTTDFIRYLFIIAYCKPIFSGITGTALQDQMKFFDKLLCQNCLCIINNHINTAEVICCFNHIVHIQHIFSTPMVLVSKDISGLIMQVRRLPSIWLELYVKSICVLW